MTPVHTGEMRHTERKGRDELVQTFANNVPAMFSAEDESY